MDIKLKKSSNIQSKTNVKATSAGVFSSSLSSFKNVHEKKYSTPQNISFRGDPIHFDDVSKMIEKYGKEFGSAAKEHLENAINQAHSTKNSGLNLNGDSLTITDKNLTQRLLSVITYPVIRTPLNLINATLTVLKEVPGLENSTVLKKLLKTKVLKNQRIYMENASNIAGIKNLFKTIKKGGNGLFEDGHKRFDLTKGDYDTIAERTLTRIVTGAIPAFFLANDAYNLSIYLNNNKDLAKKEKKRRFSQEVARIAMTAGATFAVMKFFSKSSNGSAEISALLINLVTLASEVIGRMIMGSPVLPLTKEQAKKYAEKQGKIKPSKIENIDEKQKLIGNENQQSEEVSKSTKKSGLTIKNAFEILGLMFLTGLGAKHISKAKKVKEYLTKFNKWYEKLYTKEFVISREKFNKLLQKFRDNDFNEIADKYNEKVKEQKGDILKLGKVDAKINKFFIHHLLTFPVRFACSAFMLPYRAIAKLSTTIIEAACNGKDNKKPNKTLKIIKDKIYEIFPKNEKEESKLLLNSIQYLEKIHKKSDYKNMINKRLLSSFDSGTKSNYSNADFSSIVKSSANVVTSAFLIADNYNMVMIDSQGEDKKLAEQKAKERTAQRAFKIVYGAFLIKLFNSAFSNIFNSSLLGAEAVNTAQVISTETLERISAGLPLHEGTKEEIIKKEKENLNAKGLKGCFYRLMAKLTGKKALSEKANKK